MLVNAIISILLVAGIIYFIHRYTASGNHLDDEELTSEKDNRNEFEMDIDYMTKEVADAFSRTLRQNFNDGNLSRRELEQKQKKRTALSSAINNAAYGDDDAKKFVKNSIKQLLLDPKYDIENNINRLIPFDRPARIWCTDKTNIILYLYSKRYWLEAVDMLFQEFHLTDPVEINGVFSNVVTKEKMNEIYEIVMSGKSSLGPIDLTFEDKIEIVSQKLFGRYIRFSAVDLLYDLTVDEIDVGVSGVPKNSYTVKTEKRNLPFSYESVWILYHGINIRMECLSFESQDDMIRVCKNIYNYKPPEPLTEENGAVIATTSTGGRIVVFRPEFADSWGFTLRKFDSAPSTLMKNLLHDDDKVIPIVIIKWIAKGLLNTIISGQQATGKTTLLKSFIGYLSIQYNLRIQEKQAEMNLRYTYPDRNIVSFQETASISAQEGLNIQKKTNGGINIIGEIAEAIQAAFFVQTANVASYMAIGTHHGIDTEHVIEGIGNNLLEPSVGLFQNEENAIKAVAAVLNIDIHMANDKGDRHLLYINEICPTTEEPYPSDKMEDASLMDKAAADASKYMRKVTNPKPYEVHRLVHWEPKFDENGKKSGGKYILDAPFGSMMEEEIKRHLSIQEEKLFDFDMDMLHRVKSGDDSVEVQNWVEKSLSSF